ncbi:hypothetical protein RO3G_05689 [Rhizopus delemar RA 99-880]|uniref:Uncharacterized protein n=1 Tax=Rhizopus delemar (strain RA 99-880 / ATCC MYA-4621 / FGSC 9543 / NRRL 43880) TaxID=246409 RepID=I1BXQ4_RHIO9|nr:hypothetical protein RO3G_05689 [Rhizopus delemar RA 99-880]|eukprot:EIE80984.1 hypothetical protein RO3G_05689 [Rhizopus delemar RA 99-880]
MSRFRDHLMDNFLIGVPSGKDELNRETNRGTGDIENQKVITSSKSTVERDFKGDKMFFLGYWPDTGGRDVFQPCSFADETGNIFWSKLTIDTIKFIYIFYQHEPTDKSVS